MKPKGSFCIVLGLLLIAAALFLTTHNLLEERQAQLSAQRAAERLDDLLPSPEPEPSSPLPPEEVEIPDYLLDPTREMPVEEVDGLAYVGVLRIPSLDLELPVLSQWSDGALKTAPCRYSGSAYLDNLVICAHNYKSHFGRLSQIQMGAEIIFTDLDGNLFRYETAALETLSPADVEEMTAGEWPLSLFTCTLGGQSRLTLRCDRVEEG